MMREIIVRHGAAPMAGAPILRGGIDMAVDRLCALAVAAALLVPAALMPALMFPAVAAAENSDDPEADWGVEVDRLELRLGPGGPLVAWEVDFHAGSDALMLIVQSDVEYALDGGTFDSLQTQVRFQRAFSDVLDAYVGLRHDAPDGGPERLAAAIGVSRQLRDWVEADADLYISGHPFLALELKFEAPFTDRLTLRPVVDVNIPLNDDSAQERAAYSPEIELGARLSYDLADGLLAPYVGVHYERSLGESGRRVRRAGGDRSSLYVVTGLRVMF